MEPMMSQMRENPLVVIPIYGDESKLSEVLRQMKELELDALVVNDGNGPALSAKLVRSGEAILDLVVNHGVGAATLAGLDWGRSHYYPGIVTVDSDAAHDQASVACIVGCAVRDPERPVLSNRFSKYGRNMVPEEKLSANGFACRLVEEVTSIKLTDVACGLRYYPVSWRAQTTARGFDFIYATIEELVSAGAEIIDVSVDYRGLEPWLTSATELAQFLRWAISKSSNQVLLKQLKGLANDAALDSEHIVAWQNQMWQFIPVSSRESWLILGPQPPLQSIDHIRLPMRTRPSVGFIPDGGRRWAVREKVPLEYAYKRSFLGLAAVIANCDLGDSSIYCLSAANLKRTSAELAAVYAAIEAVVYDLESKNLRPIVWGNISALPREFRIWCRGVNMRSCRKAGRITFLATAYDPAWEAELFSRRGAPWNYGYSVEILRAAGDMRFSLVLRSGGASTLSNFMPNASSYAVFSLRRDLLNDLDIKHWLDSELENLGSLKYGT
jgi:undecaprenyl pyrophosphate synthase